MTAHIIKRTEMASGFIVITRKQMDPYRIRPFETFVIDPQGVVSPATLNSCQETALHMHDSLARRNGGSHER